MAHLALYRAWRPQTFGDMVGQQHIVQTLQNAIRENRLSHAYLFSGPRGTGKTSAAKILAKAVNCQHGPSPEPCNACPACEQITIGNIVDVVEIDAASNRGVEEIRDIRDKVKYSPTEVRRKVYIIDEVHMLTTEAFNALLKTLEEPPAHVMFVLATTEPHKLPPTIISRCQRFEFRRVSLTEQVALLKQISEREGFQAEEQALAFIARLSDGGMRDAISLLDQIASFTGGHVSLEQTVDAVGGLQTEQFARIAAAVRDSDVAGVLQEIDELMISGKSADKCLEQLMYYFRDMLLAQLAPQSTGAAGRIADPADLRELAGGFTRERLFAIIDVLNRYQAEMKYASHPQTVFEIALIKLCSATETAAEASQPSAASPAEASADIVQLQTRVAQLERKLEAALKDIAAGSAGKASTAVRSGGASAAGKARTAPSGIARSRIKLEPFVAAADSPASTKLRNGWPQMLEQLKAGHNMMVRAMLIDGKPAACHEDQVLVAFQNIFHRETIEKQANKAIVEDVMSSVLGYPCRLVTVMAKEWDEAIAAGAAEEEAAAAEPLELVPEEEAPQEPIVTEALRMFGEALVEIKDD